MRIEKVWTHMFGATQVRRTEVEEVEAVGDRGASNHGGDQRQEQARDEREAPNREDLEKAVVEVRASEPFTKTGMGAEVVPTASGLSVRITHASGNLVKTMSAEEFMRLREHSAAETGERGKILDQKF
ncbi:MAG: hypothetical protein HYW49_13415 [Deltaproteobacteria bacterium]|nr:hypothetical protein [Deltaproteobacteria bacterium]